MNKRMNINTSGWESYTTLEELRDWVNGLVADVPEGIELKAVTVDMDVVDEYGSPIIEPECFYTVPLTKEEEQSRVAYQLKADKARIIYFKEQIDKLERKRDE